MVEDSKIWLYIRNESALERECLVDQMYNFLDSLNEVVRSDLRGKESQEGPS